MWCDDQLSSCHAPSVTNVTLDHVIGHAGFAESLVKVGWLRVRNGSLEVPNFDRHMSESAKKRALSNVRQQNKRSKDVTNPSRAERDKSVTRVRERVRDKKQTQTGEVRFPESMDTPDFRDAWQLWCEYSLQEHHNDIGVISAEQQIYRLLKLGPDEAAAAIRLSIAKRAKGIIDNGDHNRDTTQSSKSHSNGRKPVEVVRGI
jgi:predicted DNA-binding WGR domain protein